MSKFAKFALALSCFLPLFLIFGAENGSAAVCAFSREEGQVISEIFTNQSSSFWFNAALSGVWLVLLIVGISGLVNFHKSFLQATELSKKPVKIVKAENITADYYFTYFSLFVISFFGVDPTNCKDILVFSFLMVLIIWVYVANDMFFVNPVLNICGYKSFQITYAKSKTTSMAADSEQQLFEIRVFSREHLNRKIGKNLYVTYSPHDFSVCYPISPKKSKKQ